MANMFRYASAQPAANPARPGPLMFEPGKRWQYGQGVDWAGRLVEAISGTTLENYFQEKIFRPLAMEDTSYILPAAKFDRLVSRYHRENGGELQQDERKLPAPPATFNGGGGLYSTAADYVRFMQMILNHGAGPNSVRILQPKTVESMMTNQIGELTAGKMKSFKPDTSADVDIQPGRTEKWGLGFLINTTPVCRRSICGQPCLGGTLQHLLLDRPQASSLRRDPDAVSPICRQGSRRAVGRLRAGHLPQRVSSPNLDTLSHPAPKHKAQKD